jgi:integrase
MMLKTKSGLPKHCCYSIDRHGLRRVKFQKRGFSTYLKGTPWGEEFMRQYAAALDGIKDMASVIGAERTRAGTINALCVSYYRSPNFLGLKPSTKAVRRNMIEKFRSRHGDKPLRGLARAHVSEIIGAMAETPAAANNLLKVLRVILNHAVAVDMIEANPAMAVMKFKSHSDGHHPWTKEEIAAFEEHHPVGTRARLALALGLYTGQRKGDVIRMGWQHVTDDMIAVRQEKTAAALMIPISAELMSVLAQLPRTNLTFVVTERGAPFTSAGFGNWFRAQCDAAGLSHCSFHGLRKSCATRLADKGCSVHEIAAITGHRSLGLVAHYTRSADQQKLARDAMRRAEGEQNLSNPATRLDKTGVKRL